MKKHLFNLVAVAILLMTVLSACKKDPKGSGGGGGSSYVIDAKNIIGETNGIDHVNAFIYWDTEDDWGEYEVGTSPFIDNGFTINLPATLPSEYLDFAYNIFDDEVLVVSDRNAKMSEIVEILAYNIEKEEVGEVFLYDENDYMYCEAAYIYADRNFTMKGTEVDGSYTCICDCNFRTGWNLVYYQCDYRQAEIKLTTQKPANANLQWYYENWGWDDSPKPAKQSKLFSRLGKTASY